MKEFHYALFDNCKIYNTIQSLITITSNSQCLVCERVTKA